MIEETKTVGSDGWWLARLFDELNARPAPTPATLRSRRGLTGRRDWMDVLWSYRTGEPPHPYWTDATQQVVNQFQRQANACYAGLAVEAMLDRINLESARPVPAPGQAPAPDEEGDAAVRTILSRNGAWMSDALDFTFTLSEGYVMVGRNDDGKAVITAEDPRQVVAITDPLDPFKVQAALKVVRDDIESVDKAYLHLPGSTAAGTKDRVRVATRRGNRRWGGTKFSAGSWDWDGEATPLPVQGYGVPIVPFVNRLGLGEFEPHLDLLDRITNMIGDRLWVSKIQAFRQRALERDADSPDIPDIDPETGEAIDIDSLFKAGPDAMWELPPGWRIWESQTADMQSILLSVRDDVKEFAAVCRTPLSMFTPDAAAGSAEGASLMREGLVFKSKDRIRRFTPGAARVIKMALAYEGITSIPEIQPMWAPVEVHTLAEKGVASASATTAGVPWETQMSEIWQFSPETIARASQARLGDALLKATVEANVPQKQPQQPPSTKPQGAA